MPDLTDSQLRDGLRSLYDTALPHVMAPGLGGIRRSARRRRATRAGATVLLLAAMGVAAITQPWRLPSSADVVPPTATSTRPSASVRPTGSVSPTPTLSRSLTLSVTAPSVTAPSASTARPSSGAQGDACAGVVDVLELINDGYVTVSVRLPAEHPDWEGLLCPGQTVRVLWASYSVDTGGVQHLYRSGERALDEANPQWRMYIDMVWDGSCGPTWYVSKGSDAIPSTIPLGGSAFPNKIHWDDDNARPGCSPSATPS